jgi:hypothetical protein
VLDKSGTVLTRHASQAGRAGGSGRYLSDLLTVRGAAKPVKLMRFGPLPTGGPTRTWGLDVISTGGVGPRTRFFVGVQRTRRTVWRISQTRLHTDSSVASVAVRLTVSKQLPAATSRTHICAHSVDICVDAEVEAGKVIIPRVPTRQREGADNSRSFRVSGSPDRPSSPDARRLRSHQ